jgi:plastocyanin
MKNMRTSKLLSLGSALVVVAILSVVTLRASSSSSKRGSDSKPAAAVDAGTQTQSAADVKIDNFAFTPVAVTVKVGTQVTWINHDDIPHTVDSTDGKFKSAALDTDDKFQFRFTEPGEYPFYCRLHPKMTGKVVVQP